MQLLLQLLHLRRWRRFCFVILYFGDTAKLTSGSSFIFCIFLLVCLFLQLSFPSIFLVWRLNQAAVAAAVVDALAVVAAAAVAPVLGI